MHPSSRKSTATWLKQRALGRREARPRLSVDTIRKLDREASFDAESCFGTELSWNGSGTLIAVGGFDGLLILNPFTGTLKQSIYDSSLTGHLFPPLGINFIPASDEKYISTMNNRKRLRVLDIETASTTFKCCCADRASVYQWDRKHSQHSVHPQDPWVIWFCDKDKVIQYDIRERHKCQEGNSKNVILGLDHSYNHLALHPVRSEVLAIGTWGPVRLYDRRFSQNRRNFFFKGNSYYTTTFEPGQKSNHESYSLVRGISFNSNGSEFLVDYYDDHPVLFNTYEPWEPYKSYEATLLPLIVDLPTQDKELSKNLTSPTDLVTAGMYPIDGMLSMGKIICNLKDHALTIADRLLEKFCTEPTGNNPRLRPFCLWNDLRKTRKSSIKLPSEYREFCEKTMQRIERKEHLDRRDFETMNYLLEEYKNCAELYLLRSTALWNRAEDGDSYQSLRDLSCAVALDPSVMDLPIIEDKRSCIISCNYEGFLDTFRRILTKNPCPLNTFDYTKRFIVPPRSPTKVSFSQARFLGSEDDFIVMHDDVTLYVVDKNTTNIVEAMPIRVVSLAPHPSICMLALIESYERLIILTP